ncbi:SBBP repeat-containing protein [Nannocystis punicea]|uniref:SBBP repeat-containing protein n=1 Tax=Nannocystis punicea TaxID=2995304 RepID=A0ABY7HBJ4_9BACT|nr:SBBP repeat-containing protein [Nannocystis poenicansa]WAS96638.1 SBBP repeat-containing protein [Nannocystis poenicansa]
MPVRIGGLLMLLTSASLVARVARADELKWGTYLGGADDDRLYAVDVDVDGNIYVTGSTRSATGVTKAAHKPAPEGTDALLAKFAPTGELLWATCFGGPGEDHAFAVAVRGDSVVIGGRTASSSGIAVDSKFQGAKDPAPEDDGFVAQFTDDGALEWATYIGGDRLDFVNAFAVGEQGELFVVGRSGLGPEIAGLDSHQPEFGGGVDGYVLVLDETGARSWGTWYGGSGFEEVRAVARRGDTLYVGGHTSSATGIATPGAFQPTYDDAIDLFVAAFDVDGARHWGSYFGSAGAETEAAIVAHPDGGVVLAGIGSKPGLATDGTAPVGEADVILARFDDTGARVWSTYFGGPEDDYPRHLAVDPTGGLVLVGITNSAAGIASPDAFKPALGGDRDAFVAGFGADAAHLWGTYFGGEVVDDAGSVVVTHDRLLLVGRTDSTAGIATPAAHQDVHAGTSDGFLAVFGRLAPLGGPCVAADACASGLCSDGVCCDTACGGSDDGDCQACSVAAGGAADGTCGPRAPGPCRPAASECDVEEACDGVGLVCPADLFQDDGTACADGLCSRGACIPSGETAEPTSTATTGPDSDSGTGGQPVPTTGEPPTGTASTAGESSGSDELTDSSGGSQTEDAGCGCSATSTPGLLVLGLLVPRRRRRRSGVQ